MKIVNLLFLSLFSLGISVFGPFGPSRVWADPISAQLPYNKFIDPSRTSPLPNLGPRCAATATLNSFVFLKNMYPRIYGGTKLTTGSGVDRDFDGDVDLVDTQLELSGFMVCGASAESIWEGKFAWINFFAPDTTVFHGMVDEDTSTWDGGQFLKRGVPSLEFLLDQLRDGEDIEVGFSLPGGSGHVVTLTSLEFQDDNRNSRWDPNPPPPAMRELASIDYIDPNCPLGSDAASPRPSIAGLTLGADGKLHFPWVNGNLTVCDPLRTPSVDAAITFAYAESPVRVAEPGTLVLLGTGILGLLIHAWNKRNKRGQKGTKGVRPLRPVAQIPNLVDMRMS